jgi:tetratricopeptide (TPR) repeat protein
MTMNSHVSVGRLDGERQQPVRWPVRSGIVPPPAEYFSPRPETGFELAATPALGETVVLTPPAQPETAAAATAEWINGASSVLSVSWATRTASPLAGAVGTGTAAAQAGIGGTGKTQLAAALSRFLRDSRAVDLLAWVPAVSRDSIITGYVQAGAAAGAPGNGEPPERAAARFLDWLADTSRSWLLVLDDLTDLADLDGLWPRGAAGRVVVTTRLPAAAVRGPERTILEVGTFSPREALGYLSASLYPEQRTQAVDLAGDLGCLPLGLALASAAIADARANCGQYRARLAERNRQMSVPQGGRHAKIAAATWSISLDQADSTVPAGQARSALALIALLGSGGIPAAVLTSRAACDYVCGRWATGTPADESRVRGVLDRLSQLGLITFNAQTAARTVTMHSLVQATARQVIPPAMLKLTAAAAASALLQAWPHGDHDSLVAQALRDCTASLHRSAADLLWTPRAHPVLLRAGQSLDHARLPGLAVSYWRAMVGTGTRILGSSHASTILARDHLAAACEAAGRPQEAVAALQISAAQREQALGRDHPESMSARSSLAHAHLAAGRLDYAILLYESTVADQERLLGPDHPDTMASRGDLVAAYHSAGRMQAAFSVLERTLNDRKAILGPDDPRTLAAYADLAATLHAWGNVWHAVPLYERALAGRERVLGPDHPDTLTARADLAYAYRSADRLDDALPVYRRALLDRERVLGPDHPDTLTSLGNLASACHSAGMLTTAIPLYQQALDARERTQGPDHPDTLAARGDLASGYHSAGRFALAIPLYEQTLRDCERVLGPDHLHTLTSRANLASAYHGMGRRTEAVAAFEAALADCEQYLPPGHTMTQTIREHLKAAR